MRNSLKALVLGAAVLSVPAAALAQTTTITTTTRTERGPLVLTPDQRTTVYRRVVRERVVTPRGEVIEYRVGARVRARWNCAASTTTSTSRRPSCAATAMSM